MSRNRIEQIINRSPRSSLQNARRTQQPRRSIIFEDKRYDELLIDNTKLREVIEQLNAEIQTMRNQSGNDYEMKKNYMVQQAELEGAQQELNKLRSQIIIRNSTDVESSFLLKKYKDEISRLTTLNVELESEQQQLLSQVTELKKEIEEIKKCKNNVESELTQYKKKLITHDHQIKQVIQQRNSQSQAEITRLIVEIERYHKEVEQWKEKYHMNKQNENKVYEKNIQSLKTKIYQMEKDISMLIDENKQNEQLTKQQLEESESKFNRIIEKLQNSMNQWEKKCQQLQLEKEESQLQIIQLEASLNDKKKQVENQSKERVTQQSLELKQILKDLEQWKQRYLQVEIKLKEFNNVKEKYYQLQKDYEKIYNENIQVKEELDIMINDYKRIQQETLELQDQCKQIYLLKELENSNLEQKNIINQQQQDIKDLNQKLDQNSKYIDELEKQIQNYKQSEDINQIKLNKYMDELVILEQNNRRLQAEVNLWKKQLEDEKQQNSIISQQLIDLRESIKEFNKLKQSNEELQDNLKQHEFKIQQHQSYYTSSQSRSYQLEKENINLIKEIEKLNQLLDTKDENNQSKIILLERQIIELENVLSIKIRESEQQEQFNNIRSEIRQQQLNQKQKEEFIQQIRQLESQINSKNELINTLEIREEEHRQQLSNLKSKINVNDAFKITQLENQIFLYQNQLKQCEQQLSELKRQSIKNIVITSELDKQRIKELEFQISELQNREPQTIKETIREIVHLSSDQDYEEIENLKEEVEVWQKKYFDLEKRKEQIVVETIREIQQVGLESDKKRIIQLEDLLENSIGQIRKLESDLLSCKNQIDNQEIEITNLRNELSKSQQNKTINEVLGNGGGLLQNFNQQDQMRVQSLQINHSFVIDNYQKRYKAN